MKWINVLSAANVSMPIASVYFQDMLSGKQLINLLICCISRGPTRARGLEEAFWHASVHHPVQSEKGVSHIPLCHTIRLTNDNAPYKIQKYILTINFFLLETLSVLQADAKFSETWHLIVHRILPAFKACKNTYWNQGKSQISGYYCCLTSSRI